MRRALLLLGIGLIAFVLCAPAAARAEKKHGDAPAKAGEKNGEDGAGKEISGEDKEVSHDLFGWAMDLGIWTLVASKAIRRQVNSDDQRQLVDEALAELRQASDGRRTSALV